MNIQGIKKRIQSHAKRLSIPWLNLIKKPNKDAIWIFGFQKSGTSAIAALFAQMAGKTATIDTPFLWEPYKSKMMKTGIGRHVNKYSLDFSRDIIKEPGATFYIPTIQSYFTMDKYIFIIRNPYDNIRSILNRLHLPGDLDQIAMEDVHFRWRAKFKRGGSQYVRDLAELWLEANDQDAYMYDSRCVLVKYEDFVKNKVTFIENLVSAFGWEKMNDIMDVVDKPFQPKGKPNTDLKAFFGESNLAIIDEVCGARMIQLGYDKIKILK